MLKELTRKINNKKGNESKKSQNDKYKIDWKMKCSANEKRDGKLKKIHNEIKMTMRIHKIKEMEIKFGIQGISF